MGEVRIEWDHKDNDDIGTIFFGASGKVVLKWERDRQNRIVDCEILVYPESGVSSTKNLLVLSNAVLEARKLHVIACERLKMDANYQRPVIRLIREDFLNPTRSGLPQDMFDELVAEHKAMLATMPDMGLVAKTVLAEMSQKRSERTYRLAVSMPRHGVRSYTAVRDDETPKKGYKLVYLDHTVTAASRSIAVRQLKKDLL